MIRLFQRIEYHSKEHQINLNSDIGQKKITVPVVKNQCLIRTSRCLHQKKGVPTPGTTWGQRSATSTEQVTERVKLLTCFRMFGALQSIIYKVEPTSNLSQHKVKAISQWLAWGQVCVRGWLDSAFHGPSEMYTTQSQRAILRCITFDFQWRWSTWGGMCTRQCASRKTPLMLLKLSQNSSYSILCTAHR